jgi:hypothetical protein
VPLLLNNHLGPALLFEGPGFFFAGGYGNLYAYVGNDPISYVDPHGTLLGIPAGEQSAQEAADWWAAHCVATSSPGLSLVYDVGGVFATLWTPGTSDVTFGLLSIGNGLISGGLRVQMGELEARWQMGGIAPGRSRCLKKCCAEPVSANDGGHSSPHGHTTSSRKHAVWAAEEGRSHSVCLSRRAVPVADGWLTESLPYTSGRARHASGTIDTD